MMVIIDMCMPALSCVWLFSTPWMSPSACSVHGISQTRILEWVAISYPKGSSQPRDQTHLSSGSCVAGQFFTTEPPGKPNICVTFYNLLSGFCILFSIILTKKEKKKTCVEGLQGMFIFLFYLQFLELLLLWSILGILELLKNNLANTLGIFLHKGKNWIKKVIIWN